jgi:ATP-dependent DNA helicase RecQ
MPSTPTPHDILRKCYGYRSFRARRLEIIESVLQGRDVFALMPTGSGKSVCYQIPAVLRPGVGIVISPLIALMQDQVSALKQNGLRADFLNSSLSAEEALREAIQNDAPESGR